MIQTGNRAMQCLSKHGELVWYLSQRRKATRCSWARPASAFTAQRHRIASSSFENITWMLGSMVSVEDTASPATLQSCT